MAELYVRHSLNSQKAVKFNFTFKQFVLKGKDADHKWVLEVGTTYPASDGGVVPTKVVYDVTEGTLDAEIEKAVSELCTYIDWLEFEEDNEAPRLVSVSPYGTDVIAESLVTFNIQENLPSAGMNLSDMKVTLNNGVLDFDITEQVEVSGDPYDYKITWKNPFN